MTLCEDWMRWHAVSLVVQVDEHVRKIIVDSFIRFKADLMEHDVGVREESDAATENRVGMLAHGACAEAAPDVVAQIVLPLNLQTGINVTASNAPHSVAPSRWSPSWSLCGTTLT